MRVTIDYLLRDKGLHSQTAVANAAGVTTGRMSWDQDRRRIPLPTASIGDASRRVFYTAPERELIIAYYKKLKQL